MADLTREDRMLLGHLTERDEAGRHFTEIYPDEWLARMESAGYITIERPIHAATSIPYSQEYYRVEVSDEVAGWFDAQGDLIED